jgi:hypothetical protein
MWGSPLLIKRIKNDELILLFRKEKNVKKTNKIISILLVVAMMLAMAPISAFAATEAYSSMPNIVPISYNNNVA